MPKQILLFLQRLLLFTGIFLFAGQLSYSKAQAAAHFELSPTTGVIQTAGTSVAVIVNADANQLKSASAVITYDAAKVTVTSVNGTYFPTVTTDTTKSGEIVISGTLPIGNTVGVTGTGTLATLTLKPVSGATGSVSLGFRCSESSSDDSNLITMTSTNLLAATSQCSANSTGSYTLVTSSSTTTTTTSQCNQDCSASAVCASGLTCVTGKCRNASCHTSTTRSCTGADIAAAQGTSTLPKTASINQTTLLIGTGIIYLISGGFLVTQAKKYFRSH